MAKALFIAEKPSVAREFARTLGGSMAKNEGYMESETSVVTWCFGHLVTMSYPDKYDPKYKRWVYEDLPFIPGEFLYELIPSAKKQFKIVAGLLKRKDVDTIYVCTDSGREGEYIYRLVAMQAHVSGKEERRVWIDSQTPDEIRRGIKEARPLSEYDDLAASAFLRAKEDYLMGINFSRALTIKYSNECRRFTGAKYSAIAVGRVMTCVLGMVVKREREIRAFVKQPFYRVMGKFTASDCPFEGEWRVCRGSIYEDSPLLYKENGFRKREDAQALIDALSVPGNEYGTVEKSEKKKEIKNPPLLYNLAELQNECSKRFKISPDQTLAAVQELYEKQLVTYPRTDARVLSSAVAKEIKKNITGLTRYEPLAGFAKEVLDNEKYVGIEKSRYTNDRQITDHYAIIPTGAGLAALARLPEQSKKIYELIAKRFLAIFFPPAVYEKLNLIIRVDTELFHCGVKVLKEEGYLVLYRSEREEQKEEETGEEDENGGAPDEKVFNALSSLKKGDSVPVEGYYIKEGETSPPKRYTSGSIILAMENAGSLIEDEELRSQIKGSGIGTSATRAEILKKLFTIKYLKLNRRTQVITPELLGEMVYDVVRLSVRSLLNPELTASWEKGLSLVAEGGVTTEEYMEKLTLFVSKHIDQVRALKNQEQLRACFGEAAKYYKKKVSPRKTENRTEQ